MCCSLHIANLCKSSEGVAANKFIHNYVHKLYSERVAANNIICNYIQKHYEPLQHLDSHLQDHFTDICEYMLIDVVTIYDYLSALFFMTAAATSCWTRTYTNDTSCCYIGGPLAWPPGGELDHLFKDTQIFVVSYFRRALNKKHNILGSNLIQLNPPELSECRMLDTIEGEPHRILSSQPHQILPPASPSQVLAMA